MQKNYFWHVFERLSKNIKLIYKYLSYQVFQRVPWNFSVTQLVRLRQVCFQDVHADLEVWLIKVVWHIPANLQSHK